jgi:hypothetical protein
MPFTASTTAARWAGVFGWSAFDVSHLDFSVFRRSMSPAPSARASMPWGMPRASQWVKTTTWL